ncbi:probable inactive purple acid phosphatase 27 isoform X2 [Ananas comosus]|uniref:Purple acid phosphatase n=1 Tax=Ananas comosus TaxID=4615 RepID=A0A6P5HJ87_ANACO|nr:probable inactive purple acid phosphatase 27 isoform X2 [Ananas comosus]
MDFVLLFSLLLFSCSFIYLGSSYPITTNYSKDELDRLGISQFRYINRRSLASCNKRNPYLAVNISSNSPLPDEVNVTVTVSGVRSPDKSDWIAMISPSNSSVKGCLLNSVYYIQTGDLSNLPLLCHYPVKAQYMSEDPSYLTCGKKECRKRLAGKCLVETCGGTVTFHVINFRTDVEFVFFAGGFDTPCVLGRSDPVPFANPSMPLNGHLSSLDSTATSMRLTWVSGDSNPQLVQYGEGKTATSQVATFTQADMCSSSLLPSPAKDFGWHDPGYIHSAVMTGLQPSQTYYYRYGSDLVGWSSRIEFKTPPAAGSEELHFLIYGDMGKAPLDPSVEHYIQPGSISVVAAMAKEIGAGSVDSIFHIGDISYATGFLVEWDYFLHLITPLASHVSYMTAIGNHERDYVDSGSVYITPDSGGECGVAYESYFPMPTVSEDKPWYSIEQASVHFTVISTEHDWTSNSEQNQWIQNDLSSVDRTRTPWLIFAGHRPMYSSYSSILPNVDAKFVKSVEPLLLTYKVDLVFFGHVHNYERTCAVYGGECKGMPKKDKNGVDTYDNSNYTAPVHVVVGTGGFVLDSFSHNFLSSNTTEVLDRFHIIKPEAK